LEVAAPPPLLLLLLVGQLVRSVTTFGGWCAAVLSVAAAADGSGIVYTSTAHTPCLLTPTAMCEPRG
jgi:hypothetical protein